MEARILAMARDTPVATLCEEWDLDRAAVIATQKGKRPLSFLQVVALARVNGVKLSDVLRGALLN